MLKIAKSGPEASEIIQQRPQCEPKVIKMEHDLAQHLKTTNGGRSPLPVGTLLVLGFRQSTEYHLAQNSKQKMRTFPLPVGTFLVLGFRQSTE